MNKDISRIKIAKKAILAFVKAYIKSIKTTRDYVNALNKFKVVKNQSTQQLTPPLREGSSKYSGRNRSNKHIPNKPKTKPGAQK